MRGNAPRQSKCPRCGVEMGRGVIAVLSLEKKYLTSKGLVPLAPIPNEPVLEVAVPPMRRWVRRMSLDKTLKNLRMKEMAI